MTITAHNVTRTSPVQRTFTPADPSKIFSGPRVRGKDKPGKNCRLVGILLESSELPGHGERRICIDQSGISSGTEGMLDVRDSLPAVQLGEVEVSKRGKGPSGLKC
jgi:hypothetical protein